MATEAQINANRANAQHSTGPASSAGRLKSSHNALKTGLTGRTIVLPTDDIDAYRKFVALMREKYSPASEVQEHIVQSIADAEWRLLRIPTLEAGLYALGRDEFAAECDFESDPQVRAAMIEALIARNYKRDLGNLALQERRLRGQVQKHVVELEKLQADVDTIQLQRRNQLMSNSLSFSFKPPADSAAKFGFEITEDYMETRREANRHGGQAAVLEFDRAWKRQHPPK